MVHRPFAPQKPASHRPARYAARIREELSIMLPTALHDPRLEDLGQFVITDVKVSGDLKDATVKFALPQDEARAKIVTACLNEAAGFLRKELREKIEARITPILTFKYDKGMTNASTIEELLKQAREKDALSKDDPKDSEE